MPVKKLLFFSMILLILTYPVNAYGMREENIWIFQGSYELGVGERAYLEGATVKVHGIDTGNESSATLLIYRNSVFKEAFRVDNGYNSQHTFEDELRIDVMSINTEKVNLEIYKQKSELVWVTEIPRTSFKKGDILTGQDYRITLKEISEEGATIAVEHGGNSSERVYSSGEHEKFSDQFMINVIYIKKDTKEVFIEVLEPGAPEILINTGDTPDSYKADEYADYELLVTNNGTIPLHGIILTTECNDGRVEQATQQHSILEPGKTKKFLIQVEPGISPEGRNISIRSKVQGYDYKGNEYTDNINKEVHIDPYISVEKVVIQKEKTSDDPEFGTEQYFRILLTIHNRADFQTAVTVRDELPPSFIPGDLADTEWAVLIDPGSSETIEYLASPTEPGDFVLGNATVMWNHEGKTFSIRSEEITGTFHVGGSKITVEKQLSSSYMLKGEKISINIQISNQGDRDVEAAFIEDIPDEISLIDGQSEWRGNLEAGETKEFSYTVRAERAGEYYLPETELSITEESGKKYKKASEATFLYIDEPYVENDPHMEVKSYEDEHGVYKDTQNIAEKNEITGVEAAGFMVSSFATLFALIAIIPTFAYLFIIRVYK